MITVSKENNVLTLQDFPVGYWIAGFFLVIFLVCCLVAWAPDMLAGTGLALSSIWILVIISGLVYCLTVQTTKTRFDKNLRKIFISKSSVLRRKYEEYRFEDIDGGVLLRSDYDNRGNPIHWAELLVRNQPAIRLCSPERTTDNAVITAVPTINSFLGTELSPDDFKLRQIED